MDKSQLAIRFNRRDKTVTNIRLCHCLHIVIMVFMLLFCFTLFTPVASGDTGSDSQQMGDGIDSATEPEPDTAEDTTTPSDSNIADVSEDTDSDTAADQIAPAEQIPKTDIPDDTVTVDQNENLTDADVAAEAEITDVMLDASLEELLNTPVEVWTATKTAEHIEEAPSIIEVVTAEELERWGYETVGEALQHMLGFYVIDNHTLPNATVRGVTGVAGSESGLIKVMINGRSVAFRATAGNWLGPELIPWSAVKQIEVIRGPASALYGADAFLATVNIVLKKPADINGIILHGVLESETNSLDNMDDTFPDTRYDITGATMIGDVGMLISIAAEKGSRDGLRLPDSSPAPAIPDYNRGHKWATGATHDSAVVYAELSYEKKRGSISLSAYSSTIERGGEFSQWSQLSHGLDQYGRHTGSNINLIHNLLGIDGVLNVHENLKLTLNTTLFYGRPLNGDRIEVASDLYYVHRAFRYKGFNTVLEALWKPLERLSIVGGFELLYDDETLPHHERIDKMSGNVLHDFSSNNTDIHKEFVNPAAYIQANMNVIPDFLKLTGGLRMDYHNIYGGQLTGRAGAVFLWTRNFTTKVLYGSAFKAPSPSLLYNKPLTPGDVIGNPDLESQFVHTLEVAPAIQIVRHLVLHSTLAYNTIKNKADLIPDGINRKAANVAEVQGISWETKLDFNYQKIVFAYLGFEVQKVLRDLGRSGYEANLIGIKNVIAPPWILRVGVSSGLPFLAPVPVRIGVHAMTVGPRRASDENIVQRGKEYELPTYTLLNASISFPDIRIFPHGDTTFSIRGYNLLDANGPEPGFAGVDYPLQRRRILAELLQTF